MTASFLLKSLVRTSHISLPNYREASKSHPTVYPKGGASVTTASTSDSTLPRELHSTYTTTVITKEREQILSPFSIMTLTPKSRSDKGESA